VWLIGFEPLAFRIAAFVGLPLLMVATFVLCRRLFGAAVGVVAVAILTIFSPQMVQWSTLASGGYMITVTGGILALLVLDDARRRPTLTRFALFGLVLGIGLYIYELYLVYLALFAVAGLLGSSWLAVVRTAPLRRSHWQWLARELRRGMPRWGAVTAGFATGWSPKLGVLVLGAVGTKTPDYAVASPDRILVQLGRLVSECLPAFLGVNPAGNPQVASAIGTAGTLPRVLGVV
jgi:hypothetical protein